MLQTRAYVISRGDWYFVAFGHYTGERAIDELSCYSICCTSYEHAQAVATAFNHPPKVET